MLSGVMAQEVTTAYNTRLLTLFYCLQISSIVFSYTSILSRFPLCPPSLPLLLLLLLPPPSLPLPPVPPGGSSSTLSRVSCTVLPRCLSRSILFYSLSCSVVVVVLLGSLHTHSHPTVFSICFYDRRFLPLALFFFFCVVLLPSFTREAPRDLCGLLCNRNLPRGSRTARGIDSPMSGKATRLPGARIFPRILGAIVRVQSFSISRGNRAGHSCRRIAMRSARRSVILGIEGRR